jgi:hypothetical protein
MQVFVTFILMSSDVLWYSLAYTNDVNLLGDNISAITKNHISFN